MTEQKIFLSDDSSSSCTSTTNTSSSSSISSSSSSSGSSSNTSTSCSSSLSYHDKIHNNCDHCPNNNNNNNNIVTNIPASLISDNSSTISSNIGSTIGSNIINNILYSPKKNQHKRVPITNKVVIDVAVLCQEYNKIEQICNDHIINLDEIEITKELFQFIFYPYHDNFGINKKLICNNPMYTQYISFLPKYRTVNGKKFYLLEEIISNIESDLNISRNCFTVESLVELTNEILNINSICDLNCCSVLSSLTWCNILEIIKNYNMINDNCGCDTESSSGSTTSGSSSSSSIQKQSVIPICAISVIFKTPTPGVKNTIVRFNYRITDL
jgi:hypothetical protein